MKNDVQYKRARARRGVGWGARGVGWGAGGRGAEQSKLVVSYQVLLVRIILQCQLFVVVGIHTAHVANMAKIVWRKNNTLI